MASRFSESPAGLVYSERRSPWARAFIVLIGASMFLMPIPFIQLASWRAPTPSTLLAVVCVVLPCLAGSVFYRIGMAGARHIVFDEARQHLVLTSRGPLGTRSSAIDYGRIEQVDVVKHESDDPPSHHYEVVLAVSGRRWPIRLGSLPTRKEATLWQRRIQAQVHR